jgi:3-hydroxyisobutyrate dehydrogenase
MTAGHRHAREEIDMSKIGFIGLGNMGLPMAGNLVKKGHEVKGFDIMEDNLARAPQAGIKKASSAADAAREVEFVISMVPTGKETIAVYEGAGVLKAAKPGTLFIDASTIDIASARKAHELAKAAGMLAVDAPVSGGTVGAQSATLTFMVGGSKEAFAKAKGVLEGMGRKIVHCGDAGAGQAVKICNNMMMAINTLGACEGIALAERLGIDHQVLFDVVSTSSGSSWTLNVGFPVPGPVPTSPANRGYAPGFMTALLVKDLTLAQEAAQQTGTSTPMGAAALALFRLFMTMADSGAKDFTSVMEFVRGDLK